MSLLPPPLGAMILGHSCCLKEIWLSARLGTRCLNKRREKPGQLSSHAVPPGGSTIGSKLRIQLKRRDRNSCNYCVVGSSIALSCLSSHAAVALLKPTGTSCTEALGIIGGDNKCEHKRVAQQQIERTLSAQWVVASKSELDQQNSDIDGKI